MIASVDIPLADNCWMLSPERTVIGASAPGVRGIVVLRCQLVVMLAMGSVVGRRKCFWIGHVTDIEVWP